MVEAIPAGDAAAGPGVSENWPIDDVEPMAAGATDVPAPTTAGLPTAAIEEIDDGEI